MNDRITFARDLSYVDDCPSWEVYLDGKETTVTVDAEPRDHNLAFTFRVEERHPYRLLAELDSPEAVKNFLKGYFYSKLKTKKETE